jgi:hypothetical protein
MSVASIGPALAAARMHGIRVWRDSLLDALKAQQTFSASSIPSSEGTIRPGSPRRLLSAPISSKVASLNYTVRPVQICIVSARSRFAAHGAIR